MEQIIGGRGDMLAKPPAVSTAARKDETMGWRGDGEREKEPLH